MALPAFTTVQNYVLLEPPLAFECGVFFLCCFIARAQHAHTKHLHPFHGFVVTALAGFGGSVLVPVLLGHNGINPFVLANDCAVPLMVLAFALVHRAPGGAFHRLLGLPGAAHAVAAGFEATRAFIVLTWLRKAEETIAAASHGTAAPVFGPVILGTLAGCGGGFLPFDKGLAMLRGGPPYALVSAGAVAFAYHVVAFRGGALLRQATGLPAAALPRSERDARFWLTVALVAARWGRMGLGMGGGKGGTTTPTKVAKGGPGKSKKKKKNQ